jgi:hypothetical protein
LAFSGTSPACASLCPPAPAVGCAAAPKSVLVLKDRDADGAGSGDRALWKWLAGPATAPADFGDPTVGADYALCLYAGATPALTLQLELAAGGTCGAADCWRPTNTGYRYYNRVPGAPGVSLLQLKGGLAGGSKLLLKGRNGGLPLSAATLPLDDAADVVVQLVNADNANCWSATFAPSSVRKNTDSLYRAKTP